MSSLQATKTCSPSLHILLILIPAHTRNIISCLHLYLQARSRSCNADLFYSYPLCLLIPTPTHSTHPPHISSACSYPLYLPPHKPSSSQIKRSPPLLICPKSAQNPLSLQFATPHPSHTIISELLLQRRPLLLIPALPTSSNLPQPTCKPLPLYPNLLQPFFNPSYFHFYSSLHLYFFPKIHKYIY